MSFQPFYSSEFQALTGCVGALAKAVSKVKIEPLFGRSPFFDP